MNPQVMLVMVGVAGLWYVGHKTVEKVKKIDHALVSKIHGKKKVDEKK